MAVWIIAARGVGGRSGIKTPEAKPRQSKPKTAITPTIQADTFGIRLSLFIFIVFS